MVAWKGSKNPRGNVENCIRTIDERFVLANMSHCIIHTVQDTEVR
jgi:hypothetical protein